MKTIGIVIGVLVMCLFFLILISIAPLICITRYGNIGILIGIGIDGMLVFLAWCLNTMDKWLKEE
jgi:uncharacterized membrane protein